MTTSKRKQVIDITALNKEAQNFVCTTVTHSLQKIKMAAVILIS
jgi:hypothetical protein